MNTKRAWCEECEKYVEPDISTEHWIDGEMTIKKVHFTFKQKACVCPVCGDDIMTGEQVDDNITRAHAAYIFARQEKESKNVGH